MKSLIILSAICAIAVARPGASSWIDGGLLGEWNNGYNGYNGGWNNHGLNTLNVGWNNLGGYEHGLAWGGVGIGSPLLSSVALAPSYVAAPTLSKVSLSGPVSTGAILSGPQSTGAILEGPKSTGAILTGPTSSGSVHSSGVVSGSVLSNGVVSGGVINGGLVSGVVAPVSAHLGYSLAAVAAPVGLGAGVITNGGGSIGVSAHGAVVSGPPTAPVLIKGPSGKISADGLWGPTLQGLPVKHWY